MKMCRLPHPDAEKMMSSQKPKYKCGCGLTAKDRHTLCRPEKIK